MPEKLLKRWIFRITEIDIIIDKELNIEFEISWCCLGLAN